MEHRRDGSFDIWIRIILAALVIALLVLCALLWHEYRQLQKDDIDLNARAALHSMLLHPHPVSETDPSLIEPWMTFTYVNAVYGLSSTTLKSALGINDPRYPRLAIEEYAEDHHLTADQFLAQVRTAVAAYIAQKSS